jgi:hypothetical protein
MGEEQRRLELVRQALEVAVVPCRHDLVIGAGNVALAVPADAEAVAVGADPRLAGMQALLDERILRLEEQLLQIDRRPAIGQPSAHRHPPPGASFPRCWPRRR